MLIRRIFWSQPKVPPTKSWLGKFSSTMVDFIDVGNVPDAAVLKQDQALAAARAEAIANGHGEQTRPAKRQKLDVTPEIDDTSSDKEKHITRHEYPDVPTVDENGKPLSRNQLKKARRKAAWEEGRDDRRAKRRVKAQERKERKRADPDSYSKWREEKRNAALMSRRSTLVPMTIIYDCGYDDLMNENERISLGSQLTRAYSDNRKSRWRAHIVISSWNGKLRERFETVLARTHENWKEIMFMEEPFDVVADKAKDWMNGPDGGVLAGAFVGNVTDDGDHNNNNNTEEQQTDPTDDDKILAKPNVEEPEGNGACIANSTTEFRPEKQTSNGTTTANTTTLKEQGEVVYLSSDSPNTLTRLKPYSTYIIGGLVDKNRHKGACYKAACDAGLKTAKLPIGQFMQMQSRQVLATSHVGEIMLKWMEYGDWGKAFMAVIPKRKGGVLREDVDEQTPMDQARNHDNEEDSVVQDNDGAGVFDVSSPEFDEGDPEEPREQKDPS